MKKKKIIGTAAVVCAALLIVGIALLYNRKLSDAKDTDTDENDSTQNMDAISDVIPFEVTDGENAVIEDGTTEGEGETEGGGTTTGSSAVGGTLSAGGTGSGGQGGSGSSGSSVSFPYTIPNTGLTIENVASYEGVYLEDGSDGDVSGVISIVVSNQSSTNVEYANITMNCDGTALSFQLSDVPAGASVVVQEANQTAYTGGTYTDVSADVAEIGEFGMASDQVSVAENEDGSLCVTNLTGTEIPCVRLFYKFYMEEENTYVGGITYTAKLTNLTANEVRNVTPSHYSAGYSKVVMVRTYDTAD